MLGQRLPGAPSADRGAASRRPAARDGTRTGAGDGGRGSATRGRAPAARGGLRAEQKRKEEERKAEWERQQKGYEAEQARRDKQRKARLATFERVIEQAPATFSAAQLRVFLRLLVHLDYSFLEDVAAHFANGDENTQQTDEEIVLAALDGTADDKLTGLALRIVLSDHIGIPHETSPTSLPRLSRCSPPRKPKAMKPKVTAPKKAKHQR